MTMKRIKEAITMLNTLDMYGICHEIYRDLKVILAAMGVNVTTLDIINE